MSPTPRPLVPPRARIAVGLLILGAVVVVSTLGVYYSGRTQAGAFDLRISHDLRRLKVSRHLATRVADLGDPGPVVIMVAALAIALLALHRWRAALLAALAPGLAVAISELVGKPLVDRTIGGSLSYPSGHETATAAIALVIIVAIADRQAPRLPMPVVVLTALLLFAALVAIAAALVLRHWHYATDTIGGFGVALATVLTVALTIDFLAARVSRRQSDKTVEPKQPIPA
jgi:undecaprenyl-diphosphatase